MNVEDTRITAWVSTSKWGKWVSTQMQSQKTLLTNCTEHPIMHRIPNRNLGLCSCSSNVKNCFLSRASSNIIRMYVSFKEKQTGKKFQNFHQNHGLIYPFEKCNFFSTMLLCNFYSLESLFSIWNIISQYTKLSIHVLGLFLRKTN